MRRFLFLTLILFSARVFAQGPMTKEERKHLDTVAKSLTPIDGKAIVYIIRPSSMAFAIPFRLDCDTFNVGWVAAKTYLYTILDTGMHLFRAQSENESDLNVHLESGKIYYIEQDARMGIMYARTKIKLISDDQGKKYLSKCMVSKHNRYPNFPLAKDEAQSPGD